MSFTHEEYLLIVKTAIKRLAEIICDEVETDLKKFPTLSVVDRFYKRAYWEKRVTYFTDLPGDSTQTPSEDEKWDLIFERFGHLFPDLPSNAIKPDIKSRLDWFKRRIAKEFEVEFTRLIDEKSISSPVEQVFLMEWKFAGLDKKLKVRLTPHESVATSNGTFEVDFLIVPEDSSLERVKIAIEIDGHEFHEKTKIQVRKDKARERAIVRQGVTVLRFSGSEVVRDARGCVEEVEQFLRTMVHV